MRTTLGLLILRRILYGRTENIFPEIEKIEINVRCRIANYFAEQYVVLGYLETDNFVNPEYHKYYNTWAY